MREFSFSFLSPDTGTEESVSECISCVANNYNKTQPNNVLSDRMKKRTVRYDDSNARGKYHTIDLEEWEEIESHVINENMIGVGREYKFVDATVYTQIREEGRTDICDKYIMFHKKDWIEYRKERGEKKYQEPMISKTGVIWVGNTKDVFRFRVFVPRMKHE